jgi:hypothetical protein
MSDEEIIAVIQKILKRQTAGEFGKVGKQKPGIYVHSNPFRVVIGNVHLGHIKALLVADGLLKIEPRMLGWVLVDTKGEEIRKTAKLAKPEPASPTQYANRRVWDDERPRRKKNPAAPHWTSRRKEYLKNKAS